MELEIQIGNIYKFKLIEKTQLSNGYIVVRIQSFTLFLTTVIVSDFWVYRSNSELGFWRLCSSVEGSPDTMYKGDPYIYNYDYIQTTFIHLTLQFFINARFEEIPLIEDISIDEITNGMDIDNDENIQKIERHNLLPFKQSGKLFVLSNPLTSSYKSIVDSKHPPTKKNRSIEEDPFKQLYDEAKCGEELDVNSLKQFSNIFKDTYEVITDLPVDGGKYNYEFEEIIRVNGQINCITLKRIEQLNKAKTQTNDIELYYLNAHLCSSLQNTSEFHKNIKYVCSEDKHIMPFLLIPVGTQINELGLYSKYILAGAYICKLFDYAVQCSILENRIRQCTINYTHIGYRYTDLFPFTIEQISKRRKGPDGRGTTKKGNQNKRKTRKQQKKELDKRKERNKRKERRSKNKNKSKKYGIRSL